MLQGLDIPWGVMVDTWDLTFSSTSDVPDGLDYSRRKILKIAAVSEVACDWLTSL